MLNSHHGCGTRIRNILIAAPGCVRRVYFLGRSRPDDFGADRGSDHRSSELPHGKRRVSRGNENGATCTALRQERRWEALMMEIQPSQNHIHPGMSIKKSTVLK